jgi:hypothetical protein
MVAMIADASQSDERSLDEIRVMWQQARRLKKHPPRPTGPAARL